MGKEFENHKLRKLEPSHLVDPSVTKGFEKELSEFFLTLALVFNDLKGLSVLHDNFNQVHDKPKEYDKPSGHMGEYNGIKVQAFRILIGLLEEFFVFLKHNESLINDSRFAFYENKLSDEDKDTWETLKVVAGIHSASQLTEEGKEIKKLLTKIRGNVSFHYYQAGKNLRKGYIRAFLERKAGKKYTKRAYFSLLKTEYIKSRFYYADSAVQSYLESQVEDLQAGSKTYDKVFEIAAYALGTILGLIASYHSTKPVQ